MAGLEEWLIVIVWVNQKWDSNGPCVGIEIENKAGFSASMLIPLQISHGELFISENYPLQTPSSTVVAIWEHVKICDVLHCCLIKYFSLWKQSHNFPPEAVAAKVARAAHRCPIQSLDFHHERIKREIYNFLFPSYFPLNHLGPLNQTCSESSWKKILERLQSIS